MQFCAKRVQFIVLILILTGFIFLGKYFILKWAGDGYENAYYVALLLIAPVTIPLIQNIGIEIQRAKNMHQFRSIVYLGMALLNVVISIFLAMKWGELGAAFGTAISLNSSSGGIFSLLANDVLADGGAVYGVAMSDDCRRAEFLRITDEVGLV